MAVEGDHHILEIESIGDLSKVYNWLAAGQPEKGEAFEHLQMRGFKTVVIDTLTEYHNLALDTITENAMKSIGQRTKQPQIQDWGELLRQTSFMVRQFYSLPMHCIITVQSAEQQDGSTGATLHRPQLWGKSQKEVPAYAYIHTYLIQAIRLTKSTRAQMGLPELQATDRVALFTPRFDSMAKDQYGVLGEFIVQPTIGKIADAIYGPA